MSKDPSHKNSTSALQLKKKKKGIAVHNSKNKDRLPVIPNFDSR